ncbi:hypothetical protein NDN08_000226 [Rhodosorus marinus]|uniref:1-alkyl-2-acetylglycerophosphocholine esterase n=1 Tax=Rhodosorus marinus TaxID=101924 RepID=A0AAV8UHB4_9RHOD|nr:hypothetical protein NDN08_000226 [Rhodosorus marinus]
MDKSGFVVGLHGGVPGARRSLKVAKMSLSPMRGGCRVGVLDLEMPRVKDRSAFLARVFYPTDEEVGNPVQWIPWGRVIAKYFAACFVTLPNWATAVLGWIFAQTVGKRVVPDTYYGARVMKPKKKFPTVVHCHGLIADRFTYTAMCRSIASDGNIVFALEHRDGSAPITKVTDERTAEKTEIEYRRLPKDSTGEFANKLSRQMLSVRVQEVEAVVDYIKELAVGVEPLNLLDPEGNYRDLLSSFAGKIDPNKPSVVGHSFGATTALLCCSKHPKLYSSCVLQDPWMDPLQNSLKAEDGPEVRIPFVAVLNELTVWPENHETVNKFARRAPNGEFLTLKKASHHVQSDIPVMIGPHIAKFLKLSQNGEDREPLYESIAVSLKFLRKHFHREGPVVLESERLMHIEPYKVEQKTRNSPQVQFI